MSPHLNKKCLVAKKQIMLQKLLFFLRIIPF
jgi:hypothetical protein